MAPLDGRFSGCSGAVSGAQLGIYGKSHPTIDSKEVFSGPKIDPETGEIAGISDTASVRLERFALQSVARSILPGSQTAKCLRVLFMPSGEVEVWYSPEHQTASFGGLVTCHSVWVCPVCTAKISERRRAEIQMAMAAWEAQGGSVALLTLTHGHSKHDPLSGLLQGEQKAIMRFFGCREGVRLMGTMGRFGHIRSWEVTHGRKRDLVVGKHSSGWHPHFHILLFLKIHWTVDSLRGFEDWAFQVWLSCCRLANLPVPSRQYGVTLEDGSKAADYVAKMGLEEPRNTWGLDAEMTKGHTKRAKDGETPFDFLRSCLVCEDAQGRALFREFATCFKGKRQLVWSRGLRERFDLGETTDAELAATPEADAYILSNLTRDDWRLVLRLDARGELLELASRGSWEPVSRFLEGLRAKI